MTLFSICAWGTLLCLAIALPAYAADLILEHTGQSPYELGSKTSPGSVPPFAQEIGVRP